MSALHEKNPNWAVELLDPDAWKSGLRLCLKTLNTKSVKRAKGPDDVLQICLSHNLRKDNEGHRHRSPIDRLLTPSNSVLLGSGDPKVAAELAANIFDELGVIVRRRDAIMGIEMVLQPPAGWDCDQFWNAGLRWIRGRYQHVISAVVHRDQKRPHMHVLALAIVDGKLDGAAMTSHDNRLSAQRRDFKAFMTAMFGFRSGRQPRTMGVLGTFVSTGIAAPLQDAAEMCDHDLERLTDAASIDLENHKRVDPDALADATSLLRIARAASAAFSDAPVATVACNAAAAAVSDGCHVTVAPATSGNVSTVPSVHAPIERVAGAVERASPELAPTFNDTLAAASWFVTSRTEMGSVLEPKLPKSAESNPCLAPAVRQQRPANAGDVTGRFHANAVHRDRAQPSPALSIDNEPTRP
jgi:hypothetical protein